MKISRITKTLAAWSVLMLVAGVRLPSSCSAATVNVPLGGSIQTAINSANSGDVLQLANGTYHERIDLKGKAITLRGLRDENQNLLSRLDGDASGTVVIISNGETRSTVLEYLAIRNGKNTTSGGGGLYINSSSPLIRGCYIYSCEAVNKGGGVAVTGGSPRFEDCLISLNTSSKNGAGVSVNNSTGAEFVRCTVQQNQASALGGAFYLYKSSVLISECDINNNGATQDGGGVYGDEPVGTTIENSKVRSCEALGNGGGLYMDSPGAWEMRNCRVSGSREVVNGGGVYLRGAGQASLLRNLIVSNPASQQGGGVYIHYTCPAVLDGNTVARNSASDGGGIYTGCLTGVFRNNIIALNSSGRGISAPDPAAVVGDLSYCCVFGNLPANVLSGFNGMFGVRGNFNLDPLFANAVAGDYHLQSRAGRWNDTTSSWILDTASSPCLDAGAPTSPFADEPAPNGGRANLGAYGNTLYASKTPAPKVTAWSPRGTGVPVGRNLTVTFDMYMVRSSVNQAMTINGKKASAFGGAFSWVGRKMVFDPTKNLKPATSYKVVIGTAAKSAAGINLAKAFTWTFTTAGVPAPGLTVASAPTPHGAQITVGLCAEADVTVRIRNLAGREIATLTPGALPAGVHTLVWGGTAKTGTMAPQGLYLVEVTAHSAGGASQRAIASLQR